MIRWLLALAGGLVAASVAHEATHMAVARGLGGQARLHTVRRGDHWLTTTLMVSYTLPDRWERHGPKLVGLAPLVLGLCAGAYAYVAMEWPLTPATIVAAAAWTVYTLTGGMEDLLG